MAFIVVELEVAGDSVGQLNTLVAEDSNGHVGVNRLIDVLGAVCGGAKDATVKVAVRSTTSTPTASGGGSSATYNLA